MDFRSNNRNQQVFFAYSLSDFVPANSFPAFVVQFVSELNIDPIIESYSRDGSKAYDPRIMLSKLGAAVSESGANITHLAMVVADDDTDAEMLLRTDSADIKSIKEAMKNAGFKVLSVSKK